MATMQACHALWYGFESRYLREYVKQIGCATTIISNRFGYCVATCSRGEKDVGYVGSNPTIFTCWVNLLVGRGGVSFKHPTPVRIRNPVQEVL